MQGDIEALKALAELAPVLRNAGIAEVSTGTTRLVLSPVAPRPYAPAPASDPDPIEAEADRAMRLESESKERWAKHWGRMTRSSGAPIPPYPGRELADAMTGYEPDLEDA